MIGVDWPDAVGKDENEREREKSVEKQSMQEHTGGFESKTA